MLNSPETIPASITSRSKPSPLLTGLLEEARVANPSDPSRVDRCIRRAILLLRTSSEAPASIDRARCDVAAGGLGGLASWQKRRVESHVVANLERRLLIGELAATVRLSNGYFIRAFKVTFGATPCAYVMERRVLQAKTLMLSTNCSLAEIALACGFADQAHFSRLFRRFEKQSPSVWRRENVADGWPGSARPTTAPQSSTLPPA